MTTTVPDLEGTPTPEQFAAYIGAAQTDETDASLEFAVSHLTDALASRFKTPPVEVWRQLCLEVGHEVFKRKDSPTGSSQYADFTTGQPVRGARDPLTQVWPILRRYVAPF